MENEIQLIADGDGLAVIGDPADVELFLASERLSSSRSLQLPHLRSTLSAGATAAQTGSEFAANSGRWVKLTEKSAQAIKKYGLRESSKSGLSTGVIKGNKGQVKGFVEFAKTPGKAIANPAMLAGVGGIMAQVAMQQTMDQIIDYLATIDQKVDDVLRAQKDTALARMIGVGFDVEEAMTIREHGGKVNEVTWSKVQAAPSAISETQAYALRQLDALAERLERKNRIGGLAEAITKAEPQVRDWLAVLARCFQLQDAIAVLELDRVRDAVPDDLDDHRLGLNAARKKRLELISHTTEQLIARMDVAARKANTNVLLHPSKAPAVVRTSNDVAAAVVNFHERLGIESGRQTLEARAWMNAATEVKDKALEMGAERFGSVRRRSGGTLDRARSEAGTLSSRMAERARRLRGDDEEG